MLKDPNSASESKGIDQTRASFHMGKFKGFFFFFLNQKANFINVYLCTYGVVIYVDFKHLVIQTIG